ncbi:MAG: DUF4358 domain-containing protein [Eubacterium sp.]|nr:DUF4358 domain-containing protein [Eubacterium sp.]
MNSSKETTIIIGILLCILTGSLLLSMTACGKKAQAVNKEAVTEKGVTEKEDVVLSMYDVSKACIEADDSLPEMTTVNSNGDDADRLFAYLSDIDYEKIDSFFLAYSTEGKADEIALVKLKDLSDMNSMMDSFQAHLKNRADIYRSYDADQVSRVDDALVYNYDRYAVLVISDNKKIVKNIIDEAIGNVSDQK